ncbi:MAG: ABC transporter permease [Methanomicrobiales archaeon]|nr:ABC transporter permease [Methanomicrobiales archaeon]
MVNEIVDGFVQAFWLIVNLDPEVIEITLRSLEISLAATIFGALVALPLGGFIHFHEFRGKRILVNIIQTLYALPTVIAGLFLFLFISRAGPFGFLGLLFTPGGMVIAQFILILPILIGLTISALSTIDRDTRLTVTSLGASSSQSVFTIMQEARFAIFAAVILGFGRAISEVGAAMMIGGNIRGATRVLTTAITLETSIGNFSLSIALGIILLGVAVIVNLILNVAQQR